MDQTQTRNSFVVVVGCTALSISVFAAPSSRAISSDSISQDGTQSQYQNNEIGKQQDQSTRERAIVNSINTSARDALRNIIALQTQSEREEEIRGSVSKFDEETTVLFLDAITSIDESDEQKSLLAMTFSCLAENDSSQALDFFDGLKFEYQDLAIEAIFSHVNYRKLESSLAQINHLTKHQKERAILAFLLENHDLDFDDLVNVAKFTTIAAVPLIAQIEDRQEQFDLAIQLTEHWAKRDPVTTREMLINYHEFTLDDSMLLAMLPTLAEHSPNQALEIVGNFYGEFGAKMEIRTFETIFETRPMEGLLLLPLVRHGVLDWKIRHFAYLIFSVSPERAVDFGLTVAESEREDYFLNLHRNFCASEPNVLVKLIDQIPKRKIASRAARCLIWEVMDNNKRITQQEHAILWEYLSDENQAYFESRGIHNFIEGDSN